MQCSLLMNFPLERLLAGGIPSGWLVWPADCLDFVVESPAFTVGRTTPGSKQNRSSMFRAFYTLNLTDLDRFNVTFVGYQGDMDCATFTFTLLVEVTLR